MRPVSFAILVLPLLAPSRTEAARWELDSATVEPAGLEQAQAALARRDEFIERLSPFDLAVRMRSERPVTKEQFLRHLAADARAWQPDELETLQKAVAAVDKKLTGWNLPWPENILLVKISGEIDGGAAYTRGSAIMLPPRVLAGPPSRLERLLAHELFHVLSRNNPKLRDRLYRVVGFRPCGPVELPADLRARRITNPDAPLSRWYTTITLDGEPTQVAPILFSKKKYDAEAGGGLFDYMTFRLLAVEEQGERMTPILKDGKPVLLDGRHTPSYYDQIGRNTSYIIHPEEILADNFALLLEGQDAVPTPRVLREMEAVLRKAGEIED